MFALSNGNDAKYPKFFSDVSHLVREMHPTLPVEMMATRW